MRTLLCRAKRQASLMNRYAPRSTTPWSWWSTGVASKKSNSIGKIDILSRRCAINCSPYIWINHIKTRKRSLKCVCPNSVALFYTWTKWITLCGGSIRIHHIWWLTIQISQPTLNSWKTLKLALVLSIHWTILKWEVSSHQRTPMIWTRNQITVTLCRHTKGFSKLFALLKLSSKEKSALLNTKNCKRTVLTLKLNHPYKFANSTTHWSCSMIPAFWIVNRLSLTNSSC